MRRCTSETSGRRSKPTITGSTSASTLIPTTGQLPTESLYRWTACGHYARTLLTCYWSRSDSGHSGASGLVPAEERATEGAVNPAYESGISLTKARARQAPHSSRCLALWSSSQGTGQDSVLLPPVRRPEGRAREIEVVMDTGYSGFLTLPGALETDPGLPFAYMSRALLENDEDVKFDAHPYSCPCGSPFGIG